MPKARPLSPMLPTAHLSGIGGAGVAYIPRRYDGQRRRGRVRKARAAPPGAKHLL